MMLKFFLNLVKHYLSFFRSVLFVSVGVFLATTNQLFMFIALFLIIFIDLLIFTINQKGDIQK